MTLGVVKTDCLYIQGMSLLELRPGEGVRKGVGELSSSIYLV